MSNFKFSSDLFLEVAELERFKMFLDKDGFRKNILDNTIRFGLIKNDQLFSNGRVERDLDTIVGQKTIKIRELKAINNQGQFICSQEINGIPVPSDGEWYWVKISHQYTNQEQGLVSLAVNGDMTGVNTKFKEVLRGMPNFPARIKFLNSQYNTLEYDILEVIDDQHATIVHPANMGSGVATFDIEAGLKYAVVGTFTPGVAVPSLNKYPFEYDSVKYDIIKETISNVRPSYISGQEFYIARIKVDGSTVLIQDKRIEHWETNESYQEIEILREEVNPLIGVEYIKWQNQMSPADKNEVYIAWGMRSQNWAIDSSNNIVTLFGSSLGGKFKSVSDFTDGDFNGWRVYTPNGNYSRVIASIKQGQAINLTLDLLDIDNYSPDGGLSFNNAGVNADWIQVVPNCEEVEIQFSADPIDAQLNVDQIFIFPTNTLIARCDIDVYKNPSCKYNVKYRYKSYKEYTEWNILPSDNVGYITEQSFNANGTLKLSTDIVLYPYISNDTGGYIQLVLSPDAYTLFITKVFKGDLIGVKTITSFNAIQVYELRVGVDKRYQFITGNIVLDDDVYISLSNDNAVEGNEFRIHFDGNIQLNGHKIYIVRDYVSGTPVYIKTISDGDIYEMKNRDGGILFDCVFSDTASWNVVYQNYDLGQPFETKMFSGDSSLMFDDSGLGKVKGWFGYALMNGNNGTQDISNRFILAAGGAIESGTIGGSNKITLQLANLPPHRHRVYGNIADRNTSGGGFPVLQVYKDQPTSDAGDINHISWTTTGQTGGVGTMYNTSATTDPNTPTQPFDIKPAYFAIAFAKKLY